LSNEFYNNHILGTFELEMNVLEIQNVSKIYKNHTALDKVSFSVPRGKIFGLLGPNGAGKTSLIRIINQITAPDEGSILFNNETLDKSHIKRIGYLPEERGLYKKMPVYDQLIYFAKLRGLNSKQAKETIDQWLVKFDATTWEKKKIEELSKGMQQKIQFIVTVLHNPEFIILDEPFTGFDPKNTQLIKDEILNLRDQGATIMLSTHRMENVEEICDEVVLINKANVVTQGTVDEIRNSLKDNTFYLKFSGSLNLDSLSDISIKTQENNEHDSEINFTYINHNTGTSPFVNQNITIKEYREIIPSMQDVFLTLTESGHE
jgi:ABC-2 type transport system ATP-binding protein